MNTNRDIFSLYAILFLVCLLSFSDANAQQQAVVSEYFTETDGLSNKAVRCIIKDGYDVLWVGTRYGLNRFDGRNFRHFTTENGLRSNAIARLRRLNDRYLLVFHGDGETNDFTASHLQIFDVLTKKIVKWEAVADLFPFSFHDIKTIRASNRNLDLFFKLKNNTYFFFKKEKFEQIHGFSPSLKFLTQTPEGQHWGQVLQSDSLVVLRKNKAGKTLQRINLGYKSNSDLVFLGTATDGSIYFGVMFRGVWDKHYVVRVLPNGQSKTVLDFSYGTGSEQLDIFGIVQNPVTKNYWAINDQKAVLFSEHWEIICEVPQPLAAKDLDKNMVTLIRQVYFGENEIWQPSYSGFHKVDFYNPQFETIFRFNPLNGARAMLRINDKLWINAEYTHEYDTKTKQSQKVKENIVGLAMTFDQKGDLWTGNYGRFYHRAAASGRIQKYDTNIRELWSIWADTATGVWLGGAGLELFNLKTTTLETIDSKGFSEIQSAVVYHFQPLTPNKVWLTTSLGLYELNPKTRKITARYWSGGKGKYKLPFDDFHHLYLDKDKKTVWLATGGKGFLRWRPQTGDTKLFNFSNNEADIVHGILPDNYGFLWLSTEKGLLQFDPKTEQMRIYTQKDGLVVNEFNRISHFRDTDGTLYFGSVDGVAVIHPERFKNAFSTKTKKKLFVVEVAQYIGSKRQIEERTEQWITQGKLTLNPTDRFFTLTLGVKDYDYSKDADFFYQIKGDEDNWVATENQRITFGRLPYGQRTILVKALLSNGQYSEILEIPVWVKRPFYLTWWFILLIVALLAGLVYWRLNDLSQRNLFLEQEVARRTESIQQAKETVERQAEELRMLDKMKSRFFANISHELRTPLTLINAPLQQLITHEHSTEKRQLVQFAFNNSRHLLRLVNQILDLTKLESTELQLEEKATALLPFVRRVTAEFESFAAHKGISLKLHDELDANAIYVFDTNKVETILYNLISNALKFTSQGGTVTLYLKQTAEGITLEVTDTGRGIAAKDLPHIFDRFYQSKTQHIAEGGTGIGLAICREFVTLMHGKIEVQSTLGKGTTFKCSLPLRLLQHKQTEATILETAPLATVSNEIITEIKNENQPLASVENNNLPHLLLVEDNEDLQQYISFLLTKYYRLTVVNNGKVALTFLDNCDTNDRPSLILSDIMMPEMDGFELLQHLKSSTAYHKIPTIMLTARAGIDDRLKALRIGVDDYLTKPFLEEELLVRIDNLLRNAAVRMDFQTEEALSENNNNNSKATTVKAESEWLKTVETYILENKHLMTFSVSDISETFGMSRQLFNKRIGEEVGMTALNYIQEIQLNEARKLLESQKVKTIKELAAAVGFANPRLLSRKFVERFGKYPSDYL